MCVHASMHNPNGQANREHMRNMYAVSGISYDADTIGSANEILGNIKLKSSLWFI